MSRFAAAYPDSWEDLVDDWVASQDTDLQRALRRAEEPPEEVCDADDED